jgi:hypothetical protein
MYISIIIREDDGTWGVHFGDWDLEVIRDEELDLIDHGYQSNAEVKQAVTDGSQASIDRIVAQLNAGLHRRARVIHDGDAMSVMGII